MTDLSQLLKFVGLGEKIYLDIDMDDEKMVGFIQEIFLNQVLTKLTKERRMKFYRLIEDNTPPQIVYGFLEDSAESFESDLVDRFKKEFSLLLKSCYVTG